MSYWDNFVINVNTLLHSDIFSHDSVNLFEIFKVQKGVCFGLTGMWMQAVFCNEEDKFSQRMQVLTRDSRQGWIVRGKKYFNLVEPIVMLRYEYHAFGSVKPREYSIYLEIPAFLEGVLLYQNPGLTSFNDFTGKFQNITCTSPYVVSHKLANTDQSEMQKPIRNVFRFCMAGNQAEYCQFLTSICNNIGAQVKEFVVLLFAKKHVVGVSCKNNIFTVFDQSFLQESNNTCVKETPDIAVAVKHISGAFKENTSFICCIEIYVAPQAHNLNFPKMSFKISSRYFPTINHINDDHVRLFHTAIEYNVYSFVAALVNRLPAIANSLDAAGLTPLYKASKLNNDKIMLLLLKFGAEPNKIGNGLTPLFAACEKGNLEAVEVLLKHGADPELETPSGTPLQIAQLRGYSQIVLLLQNEIESRKRKSPLYSYEVLADITNSPIKKRRISLL